MAFEIEYKSTWLTLSLEDVVMFVIGGDWGKESTIIDDDYVEVLCIRGSEIKDWSKNKGNTASIRAIKKTSLETRELIEGDILLEISGGGPDQPVGRTVLIDKQVLSYLPETPKVCTNFLRLLRFPKAVHSSFINLFFDFFYTSGEIVNYQGGSNNLRNLKFAEFSKIKIPIPPLNEQYRIISKIEELFSELDNGVANLKLAQNQLRVYRQALLKHAFEGKITEQWRNENNPEPAEKLLKRIKEERQQRYEQELQEWEAAVKSWEKNGKKSRKPGKPNKPIEIENLSPETFKSKAELPTSWLYNILIAVIEVPKYGTSKKCTYDKSGTAVLRIPNLKSGIIDEKDLKYAFFTDDEKEPYLLKEDDILTIRSNGSIDLVGRCSIIRKVNTDKLYAGYLIRLRPFLNIVDSRYLLNVLESQDLRTQIEFKAKSTSGVNNINSGELASLIIPLCSKDEQMKIANELESQFSVIDNLEQTIESGLQKSEAFRQSILKKAFEGKLVPQDPNDEPASELFKRILEEKKKYLEEQKQQKKRKPKNTKKMSKELSIEEVLKTSERAMLAKDVWQKSKHKENIEDFYKELKDIQAKVKEVKKGTESLLSLAK